MSSRNTSRRNAFVMGVLVFMFGIAQLLIAYHGYIAHRLIPSGAGEDKEFMTPAQGFVVAGISFAFAAYAIARGLLEKDSDDTPSK